MTKENSILSQYNFINQESIVRNCTSDGSCPAYGIWLYDIGMGRSSGYGQYSMKVMLQLDGTMHTFSKHSTDSELFDNLKSAEIGSEEYESIMTGIFEDVMEANQDRLPEIEQEIKEEDSE